MKYALFALGPLLLLVGGFCVVMGVSVAGASAVDAERGWSTVIAGTTAFVGGVLVLGLAWIIKTLEDLRGVIAARAASVALMGAEPLARERDEFVETPIAHMAWPPHTAPTHGSTVEPASFAHAPGEPQPYVEPEPLADAFEQSLYAAIAEPEDRVYAPVKEAPPVAAPAKPSPSVKDIWRRVGKDADAAGISKRLAAMGPRAKTPPVAPLPPPLPPPLPVAPHPIEEPSEPEPAVEDTADWLDHALADLDTSLAEAHGHMRRTETFPQEGPEPTQTELPMEMHEPHVETHDHGHHIDVSIEDPPPPLVPEPAQDHLTTAASEEPAVIGRYEAEGTSYIMFADGSIEAQSERGVARFKSMADLKAYFESQETS